MIGRRGASLDELDALNRSRFDVFARVGHAGLGYPWYARYEGFLTLP